MSSWKRNPSGAIKYKTTASGLGSFELQILGILVSILRKYHRWFALFLYSPLGTRVLAMAERRCQARWSLWPCLLGEMKWVSAWPSGLLKPRGSWWLAPSLLRAGPVIAQLSWKELVGGNSLRCSMAEPGHELKPQQRCRKQGTVLKLAPWCPITELSRHGEDRQPYLLGFK